MAFDGANVSHIEDGNQPEVGPSNADYFGPGFPGQPFDSIISHSAVRVIKIVVLIVMCGGISGAGLVANVINIIVFFRQGALSSSSNVSLLALAFADIGCLLTVFITSVTFAVMHIEPNGPFLTPRDFMELSSLWQHVMFMQIASWITAYIAFERSMCVVFPLKMKTIFSAKRTLIVMVTIAVVFTLAFVPTYCTFKVSKVMDPVTNTTKLAATPSMESWVVIDISDYINALVLRTFSLFTVLLCTQVTVYYVKLSKSWRKSITTTSSSHDDKQKHSTKTETDSSQTTEDQASATKSAPTPPSNPHSSKERRLIRMITLISTIFLICNTPDIVVVFLLRLVPFFRQMSPENNLFRVMLWVQFCSESINSSINIVVYYRMSSRYKQELRAWLKLDKNKPK